MYAESHMIGLMILFMLNDGEILKISRWVYNAISHQAKKNFWLAMKVGFINFILVKQSQPKNQSFPRAYLSSPILGNEAKKYVPIPKLPKFSCFDMSPLSMKKVEYKKS